MYEITLTLHFLPASNLVALLLVRNSIQSVWFADKFIAVWNTYDFYDVRVQEEEEEIDITIDSALTHTYAGA